MGDGKAKHCFPHDERYHSCLLAELRKNKKQKQDILNRSLSYPELFYQLFPEIYLS